MSGPGSDATPPVLLAIESATRRASVAVLRGDVVVAERASGPGEQHAEQLLPLLDAALLETGLALPEIDAFAISIGPGAFTSLRIGLATLKGLVFGTDRPVLPVSTLEVLARSAEAAGAWTPGDGDLIPALDARRDEVYACIYPAHGFAGVARPVPILDEGVYTAEALRGAAASSAWVVGEGASVVADALGEGAGGPLRFHPGPVVVPSAAVLGRLAQARLRAGEGVGADALVPRYVRRAEAEVTLRGERFE